jgi:acyl-CoA synthetase (AMP-forming)/AMP-acid ligase II
MNINYADVFDRVASIASPEAAAVVCDGETTSWREFEAKAAALATTFLNHGLKTDSKVALYMRNGPDYLISFYACLKARLVPVNINYRYGPSEVDYLLDNSDSEAVIFDAEFFEVLKETKAFKSLLMVAAARGNVEHVQNLSQIYKTPESGLPKERSGDDVFLLYTGGTTGLPKGVIWPHNAMWEALASARATFESPEPANSIEALEDLIKSQASPPIFYIAPPFMHGTGLFSAVSVLSRGGCVVCTGGKRFEPKKALEAISENRCDGLVIVGDAFARPILEILAEKPSSIDVSEVGTVVSSGMMWSQEVKAGLLEYMPNAILSDGLGASEASSIAFAVTTKDNIAKSATFSPVDALVVDPETFEPLAPGSGKTGVIAKSGPLPLGYYKDPERTAKTYVLINGRRHMISGDHARLEQDGSITLLGRGNLCINTAGEKVYPEEVEEVLKSHGDVIDALVFGLEDKRFGQAVTAIVSTRAVVGEDDLKAHVKLSLADYKTPKKILNVKEVPRAPNGKADYKTAKELFLSAQ